MARQTATVTSKGQVTIPLEFRKRMGVSPGDLIQFVPEDGKIVLYPAKIERIDYPQSQQNILPENSSQNNELPPQDHPADDQQNNPPPAADNRNI